MGPAFYLVTRQTPSTAGHTNPKLSRRPISNCPSPEVDPRKIQWPVPACSACKAGKSRRGLGNPNNKSRMASDQQKPIHSLVVNLAQCFLAAGHLQDGGQKRGLPKENDQSSDIGTSAVDLWNLRELCGPTMQETRRQFHWQKEPRQSPASTVMEQVENSSKFHTRSGQIKKEAFLSLMQKGEVSKLFSWLYDQRACERKPCNDHPGLQEIQTDAYIAYEYVCMYVA